MTTNELPSTSLVSAFPPIGTKREGYNSLFERLHQDCIEQLQPHRLVEELEVWDLADILMKHWWLHGRTIAAEFRTEANKWLFDYEPGPEISEESLTAINQMRRAHVRRSRFKAEYIFRLIRRLGIMIASGGVDPGWDVLFDERNLAELAEPFNSLQVEHDISTLAPFDAMKCDAEWLSLEAIERTFDFQEFVLPLQFEGCLQRLLQHKGICWGQSSASLIKLN